MLDRQRQQIYRLRYLDNAPMLQDYTIHSTYIAILVI